MRDEVWATGSGRTGDCGAAASFAPVSAIPAVGARDDAPESIRGASGVKGWRVVEQSRPDSSKLLPPVRIAGGPSSGGEAAQDGADRGGVAVLDAQGESDQLVVAFGHVVELDAFEDGDAA